MELYLLGVWCHCLISARHFDAEGCFTGGPDMEEDVERVACQSFSFTNPGGTCRWNPSLTDADVTPGGRYKLNLARPYHRAMLRMLCKTAERYKAGDRDRRQGTPSGRVAATEVPWDRPMSDVSFPERLAVSKHLVILSFWR